MQQHNIFSFVFFFLKTCHVLMSFFMLYCYQQPWYRYFLLKKILCRTIFFSTVSIQGLIFQELVVALHWPRMVKHLICQKRLMCLSLSLSLINFYVTNVFVILTKKTEKVNLQKRERAFWCGKCKILIHWWIYLHSVNPVIKESNLYIGFNFEIKFLS